MATVLGLGLPEPSALASTWAYACRVVTRSAPIGAAHPPRNTTAIAKTRQGMERRILNSEFRKKPEI
jgi:hypothetical protein